MDVHSVDGKRRYLFKGLHFIFVVQVPINRQLQDHRLVGVFAHLTDYQLAVRSLATNVRLQDDALLKFFLVEVFAGVQVLAVSKELVHSVVEFI